jgi:UTP--glucose-1-phosphate uridylyltransferase
VIQYAVEEAVASGIEQIVIVVGSGTSVIEEHFDSHPALERWLEDRGDIELLRAVRKQSEFAAIAYVRQKEPLGLGHAVLMAKELIGDEPFAVLLPDDIMLNPGGTPVLAQLIEAHGAHRGSVIAITKVPRAVVSRYGIVRTRHGEGRVWELAARSRSSRRGGTVRPAVLGRYVLSPRIFDELSTPNRELAARSS